MNFTVCVRQRSLLPVSVIVGPTADVNGCVPTCSCAVLLNVWSAQVRATVVDGFTLNVMLEEVCEPPGMEHPTPPTEISAAWKSAVALFGVQVAAPVNAGPDDTMTFVSLMWTVWLLPGRVTGLTTETVHWTFAGSVTLKALVWPPAPVLVMPGWPHLPVSAEIVYSVPLAPVVPPTATPPIVFPAMSFTRAELLIVWGRQAAAGPKGLLTLTTIVEAAAAVQAIPGVDMLVTFATALGQAPPETETKVAPESMIVTS